MTHIAILIFLEVQESHPWLTELYTQDNRGKFFFIWLTPHINTIDALKKMN